MPGRGQPSWVFLATWAADVIALLLHRPREGAALVAVAARAGRAPWLEVALEGAVRRGGADAVELGPPSREAADALLPSSLGPAARATLYRESGGKPFYLESLTRSGAGATATPEAAATPCVPRAVLAALAGEIGALEPAAKVLGQGAAVVGDPFDPAVAAAAAGISGLWTP